MKQPPISIQSVDLRGPVHLVAFVAHDVLFPDNPSQKPFFLGIYCLPNARNTEFYVVLVNEDGLKQRHFMYAGDTFEYALLVGTGMFHFGPADVRDLLTVADRSLFVGHLEPEMRRYRTVLKTAQRRLEQLKRHFWEAENARHRC